ncbi:MAG TPA: beta-N-acetylhexosaminidase [Candidatus Binatia bacterium]
MSAVETLQQKIGQMFMVGCQGEALTREERLTFEQCSFGGFILFGHNCCAPRQTLSLCRSLWQCASAEPPFIAIDQEGGRVHRLPPPFTHFPAAATIGERNDPNVAYQLGHAAAAELALAGINLNFAPLLDVHSNPQNPVIGDRSFADDANRVIEMTSAWTRGLRAGGIIPCSKHFPGHGDTDKDSHFDLPVVDKPLDALMNVDLPPFVHACGSDIESLMTAHVLYPAFDPELPATLSEKIVTGLLRHSLGYDGLVFSDDMEMKAISDNFGLEQSVALAVRAGVDVLLFCHEPSRAVGAFEFLCCEAERDPSVRAQVENSYRRITELKRCWLKSFSGVSDDELEERLKRSDHQQLVAAVQGNL